ncbi:nucleoside monophosphate kinase [archaeon]|nr:nucleoside monophosphate kinase [archaeon]
MNVILLGAPCAGKGTLAKSLEKQYGIFQLSTGEMFRELVEEKNHYGLRARDEYWGKGNLVPDKETTELVKIMLEKEEYKKGVIFDGFPRTILQAKNLEKLLTNLQVLFLDVSEENLILRAQNRRVCTDCKTTYSLLLDPQKEEAVCDFCSGELIKREDDCLIKDRIEVYKNQTEPLLGFYGEARVWKIDANKSPGEVLLQTQNLLSTNLKTLQNS